MFGLGKYVYATIAIALAALLAASHWKVYVMGRDAVQAEWDKDKIVRTQELAALEKESRAREQALVQAKNIAEEKYVQIKNQTAVAVAGARAELGRLRNDLNANGVSGVNQNSATGARATAARQIERELFGECAAALTGMAEEADRLRATVIGLQGYTTTVCQHQASQQ